MASASRKTLSASGTRGPSSARIADRERDVGRHRHAPADDAGLAEVEPDVDQRRDHHAAERADGRQGGALPAGELADQELALDLQADDEEEHRHQHVVDPVRQRELEAERADVEARVDVLHPGIELRPRASWPRRTPRGRPRSGRCRSHSRWRGTARPVAAVGAGPAWRSSIPSPNASNVPRWEARLAALDQ